MSEGEVKPVSPLNRIGGVLAALLTIAIVIVVFWHSHPGGDPSQADDDRPQGRRTQLPNIDEFPTGIWRANSGPAFLLVRGKPATDFEFRLRMFMMADDDARMLIRAMRTLNQDPNAAKEIGLSDDQMEKIKTLEPPRMVISDEDRNHIIALWHTWEKSDHDHEPQARKELLDLLGSVGAQSVEPTKKAWAKSGEDFKKLLTVQQMAKLAVYEDRNGAPMYGRPFASSTTNPG